MVEALRDRWNRMTLAEKQALAPSGRVCIEAGCGKPAGTPWGPYWCPECDDKRIARIDKGFADISALFVASNASGGMA